MHAKKISLLAAVIAFAIAPVLHAQATVLTVNKEIISLPDLPAPQRPAAVIKAATDIDTMPPGIKRLNLALDLNTYANQNDPGQDAMQAVATSLGKALAGSPVPPDKNGAPATPYMILAKLVRYEGVTTDLEDPSLAKATAILTDNEAAVSKADFTLKDLTGKTWTLSALKGKVVYLYFFATDGPYAGKEMQPIDGFYYKYQTKDLVALAITSEDGFRVSNWINKTSHYRAPILTDPGGKVAKLFRVSSDIRSFAFNRDGKLVAESDSVLSVRRLTTILLKAGVHN